MSMIDKNTWKRTGERVFEHNGYSIVSIPVMSQKGPDRLYKAMISGELDLGRHQTGEEARKACQLHYMNIKQKVKPS